MRAINPAMAPADPMGLLRTQIIKNQPRIKTAEFILLTLLLTSLSMRLVLLTIPGRGNGLAELGFVVQLAGASINKNARREAQ
jgi:hypothetical protein